MANALNKVALKGLSDGTDGQVITYDANGNPVAVGPGTDGQVLTSTGAGSPPAFEDLPASGAALTGSTNNTITTVTGANAIQGEANLTFDGSALNATAGAASATIKSTNANTAGQLHFDGDAVTTADYWLGNINGKWNGNDVAAIRFEAGDDTTNKDDGRITFNTSDASSTPDERMRIEPNGNVDLGGSTNSSSGIGVLRTKHHTTSNSPVNMIGCVSGSGYNNVQIGGNDTSFSGTAATVIRFYTGANATTANGTLRGYWDGSGNLGISDGDLVIGTSGHGIDFSATAGPAAGTGTSELLDDYEEGTWTPTMLNGGSVTYTTQEGRYTKVGNLVTAYFSVNCNGGTTSGNNLGIAVGSFPFNSASGLQGAALIIAYNDNFHNGRFTGMISLGSDALNLYQDNGSYLTWAEAGNPNNNLRGTVVYQAG